MGSNGPLLKHSESSWQGLAGQGLAGRGRAWVPTEQRLMARRKTPTAIRTQRPPPDQPVTAYRYGAVVLLRIEAAGPAVLTVAEARTLAAVLTREADLAATTPKEGGHATRTFQLPDHTGEAFYHNPRHHTE